MKMVIIGIMGAGKGTQAQKLSECIKIPHISTGDIFRDAVEKNSELGIKAQGILKEGGLVPDDIVLEIVKDRLNQKDTAKGYILDGFPRTINQAEEFSKTNDLDLVIYMSLPKNEVLKRLMGRLICDCCNAQFSIYHSEVKDRCNKCGGKLISREDDTEETIQMRIKNYIDRTEPLIRYYTDRGLLHEVDGSRSIDEVFKNISEIIKNQEIGEEACLSAEDVNSL